MGVVLSGEIASVLRGGSVGVVNGDSFANELSLS